MTEKEDLVYMAGWLTNGLQYLSNTADVLRDCSRVLSNNRNEGSNQDAEIEGLKHEISGAMQKINEAGDMILEIHKRLCDLLSDNRVCDALGKGGKEDVD